MVRIQQYDTQVAPQTTQRQVDLNAGQESVRAFRETAQQMDATVKAFKKLRDTREATENETNYKLEVQRIQSEFLSNRNADIDEYTEKISQSKDKYINNITDKQTRFNANNAFTIYGDSAVLDLQKIHYKREVEKSQATLFNDLYVTLEEYKTTSNTEDGKSKRKLYRELSLSKIDNAVEDGLLTAEQGRAEKKKIREEWDKAWQSQAIQGAINADPENAIQLLEQGEFGDLSEEQYSKWRKRAEQAKKRQDKIEEIAIEENIRKNEWGYIKGLLEGQVKDPEEISRDISSGRVGEDMGLAYIAATTSDEILDRELRIEDSAFAEYMENLFNGESEEDIRMSVINSLNGGSDGKINRTQLQLMMAMANMKSEEINKTQQSKISQFGRGMINLYKKTSVLNLGRMFRDFSTSLLKKKEPEEAQEEAITNEQRRVNPNRSSYEEGKSYTENGISFKVVGFDTDGEPLVEIK